MIEKYLIKKIKLDIENEKENTYKHIVEHLKDNMSVEADLIYNIV